MSLEHQLKTPDHGHERAAELKEAAEKRLEEMEREQESAKVERPEHRAETAREVIREQEQPKEQPPAREEEAPEPAHLAGLTRHINYRDTMASVRRRMSPSGRRFSKFIHAPAVEKTSEFMEKTVARPSATAGATWTALIVGSIFYLIARRYGYSLSGSEIILSFFAGAVIGLALEAVWRILRRIP